MRSTVVELDMQQLTSDLERMEQVMGTETSGRFRLLLGAYTSLLQLIQEKDVSASRLRRMLFGARTERTRDVARTQGSASPAASPTGEG